jgi:hypothetical protein
MKPKNVRNQIMRIVFLFERARLRASHSDDGQGIFQSLIRRWGVPFGAAAFIKTEELR